MELQLIYKDQYLRTMQGTIKVEKYINETFDEERPQVLPLAGVYNNAASLVEKMIPDSAHDCESAIALYEAYKDLPPLAAARDGLWAYLAHHELFSYIQKRWKIDHNSSEDKIKEYWFKTGVAGALSGLWWAVYFTIDESREDKYELTKELFRNQTFRTRTFFTYKIGKNREALHGVLSFMHDNSDMFKRKAEARCDYITSYFSRLGTTKDLVYMDKDFFYKELERKRHALELAVDTGNVRHNREIWNV